MNSISLSSLLRLNVEKDSSLISITPKFDSCLSQNFKPSSEHPARCNTSLYFSGVVITLNSVYFAFY